MQSTRRLPSIFRSLVCVTLLAGPAGAGSADVPNVLLITVDTLRPDHLGCWGYPRGTSPNLDAFAAGGTAFETVIVPRGQTWPTLASILTSLHPVSHGVRKNGQKLPGEPSTLGQVFGELGHASFASLSNSGAADWPGFDDVGDRRDRDRDVHHAAVEWMHDHSDESFFLWVHYFAPHRPFQPPPKFARRFDPDYEGHLDGSIEQMNQITATDLDLPERDLHHVVSLYDGEILFVDRLIGRLLKALRDTGCEENTIVALTADHGEELYERNHYFSHSASIYDTVLRAPLVIRWPGRVPAGRQERGIVEAIDIAPTILGLAGVRSPSGWEGRDLSAALRAGRGLPTDHAAFSELEDKVVSIRTGDWRFIHNPTDFDFPFVVPGYAESVIAIGPHELYSHREDPRERSDVSRAHPETMNALRERILRWQRDHDWESASRSHAERLVPEELRESLRAVGYLD